MKIPDPVLSPKGRNQGLFRPKILDVFRGPYSRGDLLNDTLAGVTVGLIALPLALALGIASIPPGTPSPFPPPALGLFTAIFAGFIISALGGSRVQIGGPTAAFIPIVLLIVEKHGYSGLVLATLMAGVILVIMGLARMGTLIKFIPWPVTSGFTTGIAVSIILSQTADFLGIRAETPPPREFFPKLQWVWENLEHCQPGPLVLALACLALIAFWPRLGFKRVPGAVVAMLAAAAAVAVFGWQQGLGVSTIGSKFGSDAIPLGLPPLQWPEFSFDHIRELIGPATAIALLGAIESLLSATVADGMINDRHDSNTELIAQGVANIVCPFFGGLPATGAIARTSANVKNGGRSPVAGLVHSFSLLLIVLVFARFAVFIPVAAMSAVLVMVALHMGEWHELRRFHLMPRSDAVVLVTTFALTVVFDLVIAVEVGMVLAAMLFIHRVSQTTEVSRVTEDDVLESPEQMAQGKTIPPGVLVYRIFGPFLFGAAEKMEDALEGIGRLPRVLILRLHLVSAMDATALNTLVSIVERMRHAGGTVVLSGLHRQPLEVLRKSGFVELIGRENVRGTFDEALTRANEILAAENAVS
ncbi:MAG: SulP family inorganic anion transporter [Terrimicrobiaceae bacterium]